MREGWEYKKLGEVCSKITDGSHYSPEESADGLYPMLSVKDMAYSGFSYESCKMINSEDYKKLVSSGCKPLVNDVLLAKDGSYFKTSFVQKEEKEQAILSSIAILRPNLAIIYPDYLSFYLKNKKTKENVEKGYITGTAIKRVILKKLKDLPVPVPPISTQQQIVSELDLLSHILDQKRQQLKEYDALAESIFYDMFGDPVENPKGWEVKRVSDLGIVKIGPFGSLLHASDYISGGIPLVNPIHMKDGHVIVDTDFTISESMAKTLSNYLLKANDIVLARRGDIGRCAVISEKEDGYICGTGSLFIRPGDLLTPVYSSFLVQTKSMKEYLISQAQGVTMLNINCKIVENLLFPLPPLSLQHSFAAKIESIEHQKQLLRSSIKETEMLFQSRMDYWFNS